MSAPDYDHPDFSQALAQRLSVLRKSKLISQGTLANELGVDQAAISRVESGQRRLSVQETFEWLEALGMSPEEGAEHLVTLWKEHGTRPPSFWNE